LERKSPLALAAILVIALLAGLSGGYVWYWNQLADGMQDGLKIWLGQRRAEGFVAENGPVNVSGFPWSVEATIARLELGRANKGEPGYWRWNALDIATRLSPLKPWRILVTTHAPQRAEFTDKHGTLRDLTVAARKAKGKFDIAKDGRLAAVDLHFDGLALSGSALAGPVLAGRLTAKANLSQATEIDLLADKIQLPKNIAPLFGDLVEVVRLQATIAGPLPRAWSQGPVTTWRDAGGIVDFTRTRVVWGNLDVTAIGTLTLDSRLRPLGSGTASFKDHDKTIRSLADRGLISPLNAAGLTIGLNMLGKEVNGSIKVPVTAQGGELKVGSFSAARLKPLKIPAD
jgi:hypothetical protein